MTLDNVAREIVAQARQQAAETEAQAQTERARILEKAKADARAEEERLARETAEITAELRQIERSGVHLAVHKARMQTKKDVLDDLFDNVRAEITALDAATREKLVSSLCQQALSELPDAKFAFANETDATAVKKNKALAFSGTLPIEGGVIVENEERNIRVNKTFEQILHKIREDQLHEVAQRVFKPA